MNEIDHDKISGLSVFRDCAQDTLRRILEPSFLQEFPAGTRLIEQGRKAAFLFVLLDGSVEMISSTSNRVTTVEIINPVGLFILAAVLNDEPYLQSARTLVPSRLLMVPATVVRSLMASDSAFMHSVVRELATAYRRVVKELRAVKLFSGTERLALWVQEQTSCQEISLFRLPFEKRTLAAYLGMTPENLSRAFSNLGEYGVKVNHHNIDVVDSRLLGEFCASITR